MTFPGGGPVYAQSPKFDNWPPAWDYLPTPGRVSSTYFKPYSSLKGGTYVQKQVS